MDAIKLRNFKCFKDLTVSFGRLTILAGENATGKSSIIQALLLSRIAFEKLRSEIVTEPKKNRKYLIRNFFLTGEYCFSIGASNELLNNDPSSFEVEISFIKDRNEYLNLQTKVDPESSKLFLDLLEFDVRNESLLRKEIFADNFYYLNAERIGPKLRQDISNVEPLWTGPKGEYLGQTIEQNYREQISELKRFVGSKESKLFIEQLNAWLNYILPGVEVGAKISYETNSANIRLKRGSKNDNFMFPTNLGFGITYVLPILVCGLLSKENTILIVENPEAHLHPASQTKIGKFLLQMAVSGTRVLLETHSEHLINGIRISALENQFTSDVLINFFQIGEDNKPIIEKINLNSRAEVNKWPKGFFDQMQLDILELLNKTRR